MPSAKVIAPTVALGASAASAGGYMYATSGGDTILYKVKSSLKDYQRILSSKEDPIWKKFKEVYKSKESGKIPNISEDQIGAWCEDTLKESFNKEKYDQAMMWCVVDNRSLKDSLSKALLPASGATEKWQKAWEKFNSGNSNAGSLKLPDDALGSAKPNEKTAGGTALNKWCASKYEMKMYELGVEDMSKKVEKWCSEEAGN
ncbi:hypothetical protein MHF_1435 [Mycoplasma haemofelis Ohio2]|uniref:Lipoprotein n=1 Tax=Mycoplasma haemofelis (strain Ohio2) TaxID=859194 RepID=F6FGN1_MYCHI|nr:hypothetical protein MHF_1435 [Mycoplasma haemofelis Ohio2]